MYAQYVLQVTSMMSQVTRRQIIDKAIEIFGSRDDAHAWLNQPAMALEQQRPVSLIRSQRGRLVVCNLLIQLEYGVYV